jgi:hypothetical protein
MPWEEVMSKFKRGREHSGSKEGPVVKNRKQAVAIMLSEKEKAGAMSPKEKAKHDALKKKNKKGKKKFGVGGIAEDIFGG